MKHIVDRVFTHRVSLQWIRKHATIKDRILTYIGIEETERIVTARVNGKADLGELILGSRCGLGATEWTLKV